MNEWFNEHSGLISAIGLFLVLPFAILSDKVIGWYKARKVRQGMIRILVTELWKNLNLVGQYEQSYLNNLNDPENLHYPHYFPSTEVLERFLSFDVIQCLNLDERERVVEIYSSLIKFKSECLTWREKLLNTGLVMDKPLYKIVSGTMLSYIQPIMSNIMELWILLVRDHGQESSIPQIRKVNELIRTEINSGHWIHSAYKASEFCNSTLLQEPRFDVIMCWENDWPDAPKKVIALNQHAFLHESWNRLT